MANWHGCPCFLKPPKGTAKTNRNGYTILYNSFVRPNFSYAQIASNTKNTAINNQTKQQVAPRRPETSRQTEAVNHNPPIQPNTSQLNFNCNPNVNLNIPNGNNNDIKSLLVE
ncbi:hypothetical protein TNIN_205341 [Trichonephila inaurata madagascariensis]|uniref:Uncharacterized protein n=1 Tax=Trichonephila inaurata madagascariensis TaxID=2747483 RepID=A0A8X6X2R2_9ARAC|nr:hypothetical protein TNIN_205341 [Trichonephila inaurata madagascariensis]